MTTSIKFFAIPALHPDSAETDLNRFLKMVKVVNIRTEFVAQGDGSFWAFYVSYLEKDENASDIQAKKARVDYRELLSPSDFALFSALRDWRKAIAEKEGVPVYLVFTNEQLARIAKKRISNKTDLLEIEGVGESRAKKYAEAVIEIVRANSGKDRKTEVT
jgi:superfamily II DNA helicase RecQ